MHFDSKPKSFRKFGTRTTSTDRNLQQIKIIQFVEYIFIFKKIVFKIYFLFVEENEESLGKNFSFDSIKILQIAIFLFHCAFNITSITRLLVTTEESFFVSFTEFRQIVSFTILGKSELSSFFRLFFTIIPSRCVAPCTV